MNPNLQGNIAESKVLSYFISQGYEVYLPFGTASKCDMIIVKDNVSKRVSIKSSSRKEVKITQSTRGGEKHFNPEDSDLLVLYYIPEDRMIIKESVSISNKSSITI